VLKHGAVHGRHDVKGSPRAFGGCDGDRREERCERTQHRHFCFLAFFWGQHIFFWRFGILGWMVLETGSKPAWPGLCSIWKFRANIIAQHEIGNKCQPAIKRNKKKTWVCQR
jgi:hypothetical protein